MHQIMIITIDNPLFTRDLLEVIHRWNMTRMEVVLSAPVDLYIHRAWYENVDFIYLVFFRDVLLPQLRVETDLFHDYGSMFGYICSSGTGPLLDDYAEAGIDVCSALDKAIFSMGPDGFILSPVDNITVDKPLTWRNIDKLIDEWRIRR